MKVVIAILLAICTVLLFCIAMPIQDKHRQEKAYQEWRQSEADREWKLSMWRAEIISLQEKYIKKHEQLKQLRPSTYEYINLWLEMEDIKKRIAELRS